MGKFRILLPIFFLACNSPAAPRPVLKEVKLSVAGRMVKGAKLDTGVSGVELQMKGAQTLALQTDDTGQFHIDGLAPGSYELTATFEKPPGAITASTIAPTYSFKFTDFVLVDTSLDLGDLAMPGSIEGRVSLATAGDAAGVAIREAGPKPIGWTDKSGLFTIFGLPAGSHKLTASKSGFLDASKSVAVVAGEQASLPEITLSPLVIPPSEPHLTGVYPSAVSAGDEVLVSGTNLGAAQAGAIVYLGDATISVLSWSSQGFSIVIPDFAPVTESTIHFQRGDFTSNSVPVTVVPPAPRLELTPHILLLGYGESVTVTARVAGAVDKSLTWELVETGAPLTQGYFVAPPTDGAYHVRARLNAYPSVTQVATVYVRDFLVVSDTDEYVGVDVWRQTRGMGYGAPAPGEGTGTTLVPLVTVSYAIDVAGSDSHLQGSHVNSVTDYQYDNIGRLVQVTTYGGPGTDSIWGTTGDTVGDLESIYWSDVGFPAEVSTVSWDMGADAVWGTDDDLMTSYRLDSVGSYGYAVSTFTGDAGPDGRWGTPDDVITGRTSSMANDAGFPLRITSYSGAGSDATWFTADDVTASVEEDRSWAFMSSPLWSSWFPMSVTTYGDPGTDQAWGTPDDIVTNREEFAQQNGSLLSTAFTSLSPGTDATYGTGDDVLEHQSRADFLEGVFYSGFSQANTTYSSPGLDGKWATDDDEVLERTVLVLDDNQVLIRSIRYVGPGPDTDWGTGDDLVGEWFAIGPGGMNTIVFDEHAAPGPDGVWFTADDDLTSRQSVRQFGTAQ